MTPDLVRAEATLTRMVETCAAYEAELRCALALLEGGADAAEALARANEAADLIALLGGELEVWWPAGPDGVRPAGNASDALLSAAREFGNASARCGELVEAVVARLRAGGIEVSALLSHVRVQRRASGRYRPPSTPRSRLDLEG